VRILQDKESELAAIDDLLSSPVISSESLTLFCHRHPLIISQLHLSSSDQLQQSTYDTSISDRYSVVSSGCWLLHCTYVLLGM